ncbi:TonB-dependent receptor domain-containing protein [Erythrobacter sanguineus]|uniref:TonB-dependent Receptor Plug Domain n=1 Tax=Erythrobacter sanguineus TaxID=198312 RepID=A0A1M7RR62_9SPHN|nr:TonB-dependent receptor [Erythrobacter sanguineus]SHN48680.1 TonB-dependent Receptor Plug Domain [Erythrobacter sanguineus]
MNISKNVLIRRALLSTTLLSGVVGLAPASADDDVTAAILASSAAAEDAVDGPDEEAIVVTGSRLRRDSNLDSPSPVVSISSEAFRGEQEVADALRTIPALSASISSAQSVAPGENDSGGAIGTATLNLRGLGAERTLVLVNGRRHVAGVAETSVVDINTIPASLIKEVEVLTGGASAIYGADAVTGVVNFILDREFDGLELGLTGSLSDNGDGLNFDSYVKFGKNFADGRGNVTLVGEYSRDDGLRFGDRAQFRDGNIASNGPNPALRFQRGDLGTDTPNFSNFFNVGNGFFPYGFVIPTPGSSRFNAIFPTGTTPTGSEQALIDRALAAPTRLIGSQYQFSITSAGGIIIPGNFADPFSDIDGNGQSDCTESFVGFNGLFDYNGFGAVGGCYIATETGIEVIDDGLIASNFNSFGGDGVIFDNNGFLIPQTDRYGINLLSDFDINDNLNAYFEGKYFRQETTFGSNQNSFYDLLTIAPDNPFIPDVLRPISDASGGLFITRDPTDLGANIDTNISETFRFVGGLKGSLSDEIDFDVSANWGRYDLKSINRNNVLYDRFLAAIDVTSDAQGNPVCRSELDPTVRSPSTPFGIPTGEFGYLTFVPGQGQCSPANLFGVGSISPEAVNFITTTTVNTFRTELFEIHALVSGDTSAFFNLPYDNIQFAFGAEYREEKSRSGFDPLVRGILPVTTADGTAGQFVGDAPGFNGQGFSQTSLGTPPDGFFQNSGGKYDVVDIFGEIGTTLIQDVPLINELRLELAGRFSDYSTIGSVFTYAVNGFWSPIEDLRIRGTYSRAVRAPNISELFAPAQAAFFRPFDPCDQTEIDRLQADGFANIANRIANCRADGIPEGFSDPLSARFAGTISGNTDLREETADTYTVGVVLQPRFIPGLAFTADYYNIGIEDAISTIAAQDVVDNCYDSTAFPNDFCGSFTRNRDATSAQFLGFNSLNLTTINFVRIETAGVDASLSYRTNIGNHRLGLSATASWVDKIDFFFDPTDSTRIDPELGEIQRPEWSGRATATYGIGDFNLNYTVTYLGSMGLRGVEIETLAAQFGPAGLTGETWTHNIGANHSFPDLGLEVFGGINNLSDVKPFITERAYPASPIGRSFFLGVRWTL